MSIPAEELRWKRPVRWYRTPVTPALLKALQTRSNRLGALQTGGYLALLLVTGGLTAYSFGHWPWAVTALLLLAHGTCFAFQINAVHELAHGTVFRTGAANEAFVRVFAFLGWINYPLFAASHARHHQFTLHPPDDLEVVLPINITWPRFLRVAVLDPGYLWRMIREALRLARGRFVGEWELALFPALEPARRRAPIRWARTLLAGHAVIVSGSAVAALLWDPLALALPLLTTLGKGYGGWLFFACNNSQHIATQQHVDDFRLCSRTVLLHPFVEFLYWRMNFHTDHHMYTQVPCYRLSALHRAIAHDLPPPPIGLVATWREIAAAKARMA